MLYSYNNVNWRVALLKKFRKALVLLTILSVTFGIVWSSFLYNSRPLPFDGAVHDGAVVTVAKDAANKVNETAKKAPEIAKKASDIDFGKIWEDTKKKAQEFGDSVTNNNSSSKS